MKKIVHMMPSGIITNGFIKFLDQHFKMENHSIFIYGLEYNDENLNGKFYTLQTKLSYLHLLYKCLFADKIILHGLFSLKVTIFIFINLYLLDKTSWVIWGSELYSHINFKTNSFRSRVKILIIKTLIKNYNELITYVPGDYELAVKHFGAKGILRTCIMYPSNIVFKGEFRKSNKSVINILVGHNSSPRNNHLKIFEKIKNEIKGEIKIICPLSYGDENNAAIIIQKGRELFGDNFLAITKLMDLNQYIELLSDIDIAIFDLNRQEAMGNMIKLIGMGKKVYLRDDTNSWEFFKSLNLMVYKFNQDNLDLFKMDNQSLLDNIQIVRGYFNEDNLINQLENLFNS